MSCDEHVLSNKTIEQRILYGKAIISCAAKSLAKWQCKPSAQGHQNVLVQLDFAIDPEVAIKPSLERAKVIN